MQNTGTDANAEEQVGVCNQSRWQEVDLAEVLAVASSSCRQQIGDKSTPTSEPHQSQLIIQWFSHSYERWELLWRPGKGHLVKELATEVRCFTKVSSSASRTLSLKQVEKVTGATTECFRQRGNSVLQHWTIWENWCVFCALKPVNLF